MGVSFVAETALYRGLAIRSISTQKFTFGMPSRGEFLHIDVLVAISSDASRIAEVCKDFLFRLCCVKKLLSCAAADKLSAAYRSIRRQTESFLTKNLVMRENISIYSFKGHAG
jgi:hypothetical protein